MRGGGRRGFVLCRADFAGFAFGVLGRLFGLALRFGALRILFSGAVLQSILRCLVRPLFLPLTFAPLAAFADPKAAFGSASARVRLARVIGAIENAPYVFKGKLGGCWFDAHG